MRREFVINSDLLRAFANVARTVFGYQAEAIAARDAALNPVKLAQAVQRISDFYISKPTGKTPYELPGAPAAYLLYYTLLNHVRALAVFREAKNLGFFEGIHRVVDWGSGMGAAWLALQDTLPEVLGTSLAFDRSTQALDVQRALRREFAAESVTDRHLLTSDEKKFREFMGGDNPDKTLAVFSYSLTELDGLPRWVQDCEALAIIEPGTNQDGRRLLAIREDLIRQGYKVWAPCTHQGSCPLLIHSKTDWCHDRIQWRQPDFYSALEQHLPMKHRTLVFSYLLARKKLSPPAKLNAAARLTGDQQNLKGQTRQMVCRGTEREFLSWQHRHGEPPEFARGELVKIDSTAQKKGADIRVIDSQVARV